MIEDCTRNRQIYTYTQALWGVQYLFIQVYTSVKLLYHTEKKLSMGKDEGNLKHFHYELRMHIIMYVTFHI